MGRENEIVAIPRLLEVLELKGALVTIDAIGCQKAIAAAIRGKEADYLLALKGNQPALNDDVRLFFEEQVKVRFRRCRGFLPRDRGQRSWPP